jgi:hypothetical protein
MAKDGGINMFFVSKARYERDIANLTCDLDEAETDCQHYRSCWMSELDNVKRLEQRLLNETEKHAETKKMYQDVVNRYLKADAESVDAKRENVILRQIIEDLSGKSADELIEAHKRAVRKLEYEITTTPIEEDK